MYVCMYVRMYVCMYVCQVTETITGEIQHNAQASQNVVRHGFAKVLKMTEAVGIDAQNIQKVEQALDQVKRFQHMLDEESKEVASSSV